MCFNDILQRKNAFRAIKISSSKGPKIEIFQKGLTHVLVKKMAIFPTPFFREYRPGKYVLRYSRTKKRLSRL